MIRLAAGSGNPDSGVSRRIVRFVRRYAATSSARSCGGWLHGRPSRPALADRVHPLAPPYSHQMAGRARAEQMHRDHPQRDFRRARAIASRS